MHTYLPITCIKHVDDIALAQGVDSFVKQNQSLKCKITYTKQILSYSKHSSSFRWHIFPMICSQKIPSRNFLYVILCTHISNETNPRRSSVFYFNFHYILRSTLALLSPTYIHKCVITGIFLTFILLRIISSLKTKIHVDVDLIVHYYTIDLFRLQQ